MKLKIIETEDGSFTYQKGDITYRSTHGAKSESLHVFVQASQLLKQNLSQWYVLELGFGTGMNLAATFEIAQKNNIKLVYYSLEPNLMPVNMLIVPDFIKNNLNEGVFENENLELHILPFRWQDWDACLGESQRTTGNHRGLPLQFPNENLNETKRQPPQGLVLQDTRFGEGLFDAYYHDPFGPSQSPQCWTPACFEWAYSLLKDDGILTTYGASGQARRAMQAAHFVVAKGPGSGRKREMTIAGKHAPRLEQPGYESFTILKSRHVGERAQS